VAGLGNAGPATSAYLNSPESVALDRANNLYIADTADNMIRKVDAITGNISTVAGTGAAGFSGDSGPAIAAELSLPHGVALDNSGNLLIVDTGNNRVRRVGLDGVITTIAGSSSRPPGSGNGDGGPATNASLSFPRFAIMDPAGNLYISDSGDRLVRRIDTSGTITTIAGNGRAGSVGSVGDGGAATSAEVTPEGLALDSAGNLYIADYGNNLIRKITNGTITSIAGTGTPGYTGDASTATKATLQEPEAVAVDASGNIFIADSTNNVIREVSGGVINTIAGNGNVGHSGDGGPADAATFDYPTGLIVTSSGTLYVADSNEAGTSQDSRIRLLTPVSAQTPVISTAGIVPVFSTATTISPGSWISIFGSNFANGVFVWNGDFPTQLGNVVVTIDSKSAYLWYVSPGQINAQVPADSNTGGVTVAVTTPGGTATQTVSLSSVSPSFCLYTSKYAVAIMMTPGTPGNSGLGYDVIGPSGAFSFPSRPAKPGETVILYGVGFGATQPTVSPGQAFSGVAYSQTVPNILIGDIPVEVDFAGIVEAGLFQFNIVVPSAGSGDLILQAYINGASTQSNIYLTLQ